MPQPIPFNENLMINSGDSLIFMPLLGCGRDTDFYGRLALWLTFELWAWQFYGAAVRSVLATCPWAGWGVEKLDRIKAENEFSFILR